MFIFLQKLYIIRWIPILQSVILYKSRSSDIFRMRYIKWLSPEECQSSESKTDVCFQDFLLTQAKVAFGDGYWRVVEKLHQLAQCQFCVVAVHVVNLPAKSLSQTVTTEMLYLQPVLAFEFFQYHVDALHRENRAFLTDKDRSCNAKRMDMFVAVPDMFL